MVLLFSLSAFILNLSGKGEKFLLEDNHQKEDWMIIIIKNSREKIANIDFCDERAPWPSANATHGQIGSDLHQHGRWNDTSTTPQRRLRHELAWIWTDLLIEQRRRIDQTHNSDKHIACVREHEHAKVR